MRHETTTIRLYLMRILYTHNFILLGLDVWPVLLKPENNWNPRHGVAFSFWGALSLLSGLGIRYPLRMVPLLLLQMCYKIIWLLAIAPSLWPSGRATEMIYIFVIGLVLDILVIPWPYVWHHLARERGDRWR